MTYNASQADCKFHSVTLFSRFCDNVGMAKKVRPNFKPTNRHFIKEWRKFRGLSQIVLGERLGVTHSTISQLETGKIKYTQDMLEALAEALNTDPASLIMRDPSQGDAVWTLWDQAKAADRPKIIAVIKAMIGEGTGTGG